MFLYINSAFVTFKRLVPRTFTGAAMRAGTSYGILSPNRQQGEERPGAPVNAEGRLALLAKRNQHDSPEGVEGCLPGNSWTTKSKEALNQ